MKERSKKTAAAFFLGGGKSPVNTGLAAFAVLRALFLFVLTGALLLNAAVVFAPLTVRAADPRRSIRMPGRYVLDNSDNTAEGAFMLRLSTDPDEKVYFSPDDYLALENNIYWVEIDLNGKTATAEAIVNVDPVGGTLGDCDLTITGSGTLILEGGHGNCEATIYAKNFTKKGDGTVICKTIMGYRNGIVASSGAITIEEGDVQCDTNGNGLWAQTGDIRVTGGKVTVTSKLDGLYYGLHAKGNISISGGTLNVTAKGNYGVYAEGNISVSGGSAEVDAEGVKSAVYAAGTLSIVPPLPGCHTDGHRITDASGKVLQKTSLQLAPVVTLSAPTLDFGSAQEGYTTGAGGVNRKPLTVTNEGGADAGLSAITIGRAGEYEALEFLVGGNPPPVARPPATIGAAGSGTWKDSVTISVMPKAGLPAGNYDTTLTIELDSGRKLTADIRFSVTAEPVVPGACANGHAQYDLRILRRADEHNDGVMVFVCSACGHELYRERISGYGVFQKNTAEKIRNAVQGATLSVSTRRWISFNMEVMEALAARPDVTLTVSFLDGEYRGNRYTFTIPAGTDVHTLWNGDGYAGFLFLGGRFGLTPDS